MEYHICKSDDELIHWGIKGMKWGVRRYQNKDGSLTNAGKKRRAKLESELAQLKGKKSSTSRDAVPKTKSVNEMTNKELQKYTTRMQLEKQYYDAKRSLDSITPKQVSNGQKFVDTVMNDVVKPWAKESGKKYLDSMIKKTLGIKEEQKINWDDMIKKQSYEKGEKNKIYEDLKRANDIEQEKRRKQKMDADADTGKSNSDKSEAKNNSTSKVETSEESATKKASSTKNEKQESSSYEKVYEGEVVGEGTSKKQSSSSNQNAKKSTVIDAEWSEVVVSDVPATVTNRGQSYIAGLLEAPKERDD